MKIKGMMKKGTAAALGSVLAIGLLLGTGGALKSVADHKLTKDTVSNSAMRSNAENAGTDETGDTVGTIDLVNDYIGQSEGGDASDINDIMSVSSEPDTGSGEAEGSDSTGTTGTSTGAEQNNASSAGQDTTQNGGLNSNPDSSTQSGTTGTTSGDGQNDDASAGQDTAQNSALNSASDSSAQLTTDGSTTNQANGTGQPTVTINSSSVTVKEGESATFSVTVSDPDSTYTSEAFSYQWQKKEASGSAFSDIEEATNDSYTISNVQSNRNGEQYRCQVSYVPSGDSSASKITSDAATLNVTSTTATGPSITTDLSSSYTATAGNNVTFTIAAKAGSTGSTLKYEWYKDGSPISDTGTNSNSYTLNSVTTNDNDTTYYCKVTETDSGGTTLGTVTSKTVKLTVTDQTIYTVTVNNGTADSNAYTAGDTVSITAMVPSGNTFKQWTSTDGVNFADSKAETTTFTMPAKNVTVTAELNSGTTEDYSITITKQPEKVSILAGGSAVFTTEAAVSPSAELVYQWTADYNDGKGFVDVATGSTYTISNVPSTYNGAIYRCKVSVRDYPEYYLYTNTAVLTIGYQITVNDGTASPATGNAGESITIKANTPQEGYEFKQWTVKKGNVILKDEGKAQTVFVMPASDVELTAEFQQTLAKPVITTQPESVTVYAGETTSFKVEASGEELTYQWMLDKTDGKGFQKITGATEKVLRVYTQDGSMNGYKYKCTVTNRSGSVDSKEAVLTVRYKITDGANSIWKKGSSDGQTFQGNGAYTKFRSIKIDEQYIGGSNYTKKSDPTIVTLVASYLETLSVGDHNLTMVWEDGIAETVFTVSAGSSSGSSSSGSVSGNTANNAAGNAANAAAGGSSGDSAASSAGEAESADSTTASAAQQDSGETELVDMPIVSHSESTKTDADVKEPVQAKKTEQSVEAYLSGGANGSVITSLNGDLTKKQSKLNEYAATASIIVILMSAIGAILVFAVRSITTLYQSRRRDR